MPSHYINGCTLFRTYARANLVRVTDERLSAALGIPIIHLRQNKASFAKRCSEPQSEAVADLLGLSIADCRTETDLTIAP